jgi:aerobic carbon-monoxide dehydrogenase medium subunit
MQHAEFLRPASIADAVAAMVGDAAFLAGGHTLIPAMKARLRAPERLIDLSALGLAGITLEGDRLWIGATTTHATVAASDMVARAIPGLAALALLIGDPAVRNRGTIGGVIANNDPSADYPAALLALDGVIETDRGRHAADAYFQGMFTTALADGELITRVGFRVPAASAYAKFRHPASRYALAGVYVARYGADVRVAVTGAAYAVLRWATAEAALAGDFSAGAVAGLALESADLNSDIHASAAYRGHLAGVMLRQAVAEISNGKPVA